jgi:hypothetical protein
MNAQDLPTIAPTVSARPAFLVALQPGDLIGHYTNDDPEDPKQIVLLPEDLQAAVNAGAFEGVNVHMGHSDPETYVHDPLNTAGILHTCRWDAANGRAVCTLTTSSTAPGQQLALAANDLLLYQQGEGPPAPHYGLSGEWYGELREQRDDGRVPITIDKVVSVDVVDQEALTGSGFIRRIAQAPAQAGQPAVAGRVKIAASVLTTWSKQEQNPMDPNSNPSTSPPAPPAPAAPPTPAQQTPAPQTPAAVPPAPPTQQTSTPAQPVPPTPPTSDASPAPAQPPTPAQAPAPTQPTAQQLAPQLPATWQEFATGITTQIEQLISGVTSLAATVTQQTQTIAALQAAQVNPQPFTAAAPAPAPLMPATPPLQPAPTSAQTAMQTLNTAIAQLQGGQVPIAAQQQPNFDPTLFVAGLARVGAVMQQQDQAQVARQQAMAATKDKLEKEGVSPESINQLEAFYTIAGLPVG